MVRPRMSRTPSKETGTLTPNSSGGMGNSSSGTGTAGGTGGSSAPPTPSSTSNTNNGGIGGNNNHVGNRGEGNKLDIGPPGSRRTHTIMTAEEAATGKRSFWAEMEITGNYK